jgi:hypothetical protein
MLDQATAACICRDHEPSTFDRPELFLPVIFVMFVSFGILLVLAGLPFGVQIGSLVPYTALVLLGTFSAQRGQKPYFFECPIVHRTMPRLVRRHGYFLLGIVAIETIGFQMTRYMPASWLIAKGRDGSPFTMALCVICLCIAFTQIFTNRALLERAHREIQT